MELLSTSVRETIRDRLVSHSDHALRVAEYLSVPGASTLHRTSCSLESTLRATRR